MPGKSEPTDTGERDILLGWLTFHRMTLAEKCSGLTDDQLVQASAPPSDLTLLGLIRHLTIMEQAYLNFPLGAAPFDLLYCTDENPDGDFAGLVPADVEPSMQAWRDEQARADAALGAVTSLDQPTNDEGRTVRWVLAKVRPSQRPC